MKIVLKDPQQRFSKHPQSRTIALNQFQIVKQGLRRKMHLNKKQKKQSLHVELEPQSYTVGNKYNNKLVATVYIPTNYSKNYNLCSVDNEGHFIGDQI